MHTDAPRYPRLLLATIFLLTLVDFLQTGMLAFAAAPIMGEIGAAPEDFSLVSAVYACVAVAAISKQRWLVERMGWRHFMLASLAVFMLGAVVCASSQTLRQFMAGRILMALGGSTLMMAGRLMINIFPPSPARFRGIWWFATGLACGVSLAPWLAALAVTHFTWQAIFGVLIIIALVIGAISVFCLPAQIAPAELRTQSHPVMLMLLMAGSFLLLYAFQRSYYDFYDDATFLAAIGLLGLLTLFYYVRSLWRHEQPLLNFRILHSARYWIGVSLFTTCYLLMAATSYTLPALMQRGMGYAWESIGSAQSVGMAGTLLAWLVMGKLLPKRPSPKKYFVIGFICLAVFGWQFSRLSPDAHLWRDVVPVLLLYGCFVMLVLATTAIQTFKELQHHETSFSNAQQVKNMLSQFGSSLGITLATLCMQVRSTTHYATLNSHLDPGDARYLQFTQSMTDSLSSAGVLQAAQAANARLAQMISQQATLMASLDFFHVLAIVGCAGAVVMGLQKAFR